MLSNDIHGHYVDIQSLNPGNTIRCFFIHSISG